MNKSFFEKESLMMFNSSQLLTISPNRLFKVKTPERHDGTI